jgi:hypothetical protein
MAYDPAMEAMLLVEQGYGDGQLNDTWTLTPPPVPLTGKRPLQALPEVQQPGSGRTGARVSSGPRSCRSCRTGA